MTFDPCYSANVLIGRCPLPLQQILDCPLRSDTSSQHLVPLPIGQPAHHPKIGGNGGVEVGGVRGNMGGLRQETGRVCPHMGVACSILVLQHVRGLLPCFTATCPLTVTVARQLPLPAAHPPPAEYSDIIIIIRASCLPTPSQETTTSLYRPLAGRHVGST